VTNGTKTNIGYRTVMELSKCELSMQANKKENPSSEPRHNCSSEYSSTGKNPIGTSLGAKEELECELAVGSDAFTDHLGRVENK